MMKLLKITAMVIVTILLWWAGIFVMQHQSSAAFELGIALIFAGFSHGLFWPDDKPKPSGK